MTCSMSYQEHQLAVALISPFGSDLRMALEVLSAFPRKSWSTANPRTFGRSVRRKVYIRNSKR